MSNRPGGGGDVRGQLERWEVVGRVLLGGRKLSAESTVIMLGGG